MNETAADPQTHALSPEALHRIHGYWHAANCLSAGQIYLLDNPRMETALLRGGGAG